MTGLPFHGPDTRIGSLFSGAGGLDLAVERVTGGTTAWHAEVDPSASKVLAARWPGVPNHGSVTAIDWAAVEPVEVLCGGFPCQDVSSAGKRAGIAAGTRSGLWASFATAIDVLRPQLVVIENVRGLLSAKAHRHLVAVDAAMGDPGANGPDDAVLRAAGRVLGDLADLGFDAEWQMLAASGVGAPHRRERVFIAAYPRGGRQLGGQELDGGPLAGREVSHGRHPDRRVDPLGAHRTGQSAAHSAAVDLLPTPSASDGAGGGPNNPENRLAQGHHVQLIDMGLVPNDRWGKYAPALDRWEQLTRPAPSPTEPNTKGTPRLNAAFAEWMMGWPAGWVTDPDLELKRPAQLKIIGNGVVPQQAYAALTDLLATIPSSVSA